MHGWMESILQKDPISSHFSGNECVYRKELFLRYHCIVYIHTRSQARDLRPTHRKQTVGLRCPSYHRKNLFCSTLMGRCLIACCYKLDRLPVTEKRHSTGTDPADMSLIKQYVQQVAVTFLICMQHLLPKTKVDWQNISLLNSVQRLAETNIHQSLFLAFAHQF